MVRQYRDKKEKSCLGLLTQTSADGEVGRGWRDVEEAGGAAEVAGDAAAVG